MIKNNNFDFLRFVFALFVVVSHSYELSGNSETLSWVNKISNGQIIFSQIGLSGFFVISGFFIFKSLNRSNSLLDYFKKRILRIFPALFFVLLISIALVFFLYKGNTPFFKNPETYSYFLYNFSLYKFQGGIKGVFDSNPYHSINGSLWTIRYEFCLYMVLSLLYYFRKKKNVVIFCLCFISLFLIVMYNFFIERFSGSKFFGFQGAFVLNLGTFFITGSLLASLQFEISITKLHYRRFCF
jgi:peptidoglycan/LPS O-acetylase OafA/YrhL